MPVFSRRALQVIFLIEFALMMALLSTARAPGVSLVPVYLYVLCIPTLWTIKIFHVLGRVDDGTLSPWAQEQLYTLAFLFPILSGILPLVLILRYAAR